MGAQYRDGETKVEARPAATAEHDLQALKQAFELYTRTAQSMEESYRRLEARLQTLDNELQQRNRELALTTDYLNSILDSMSDGVIAVDNGQRITTFNRAAASTLGHAPEDIIGKPFHEVFGRPFSQAPLPRVLALKNRGGENVPTTERDSPIDDRAGTRIGTVKVFQDLSEIEALRQQVRRKDRLAAIGEMAATVAHEIRNPLGGIRGFTTLLQRDTDPADPRARLIEKILAGTKNLEAVVNELLEYTRPVELELKTENCRRMVDTAIGYLGDKTSAISIQNTVPEDITVVADAAKMRQVLLNILLNAQQSIHGSGAITIHAEEHGPQRILAITDTGCGIPKSEQDRVFSPFYTTKEKGTGLGLAVAAKIVESHGGTLELESQPGKGSTFRVRLHKGET